MTLSAPQYTTMAYHADSLLLVNRMSALHVEPRVFSSSAGLTDSCRAHAYQSTRHVTSCMCWPCKVMCLGDDQKYVQLIGLFCFLDCDLHHVLFLYMNLSSTSGSSMYCWFSFLFRTFFFLIHTVRLIENLIGHFLDPWHAPISLFPWWTFCLCPTGRWAGCDYRDRSARKEPEGEEGKEAYVKIRFTLVHLHYYWKRTQSTRCAGWLYALLLSRRGLLQAKMKQRKIRN